MSENIGRYNVIFEILTKQQGDISKLKNEATGLEKQFNSARNAFGGIVAAAAVQQAIGRIFDVTKKYQQYNTILKVATGSQREASKSLQLIETAAKETIFSVDELTSSYIKLANRGIKPSKEDIANLADLAASQGKSFDQLIEASLDAQSNEFERLKEFGVRATKEGNVVKLAFKGTTTEIENTPQAINKAIIALGRLEGVAGSNVKQMKDLSGQLSNIGDNSEKISRNLGERLKGIFTEAVGAVAKFIEKIAEYTTIPFSEKIQEEQTELNVLVQSITQSNISQEKRNGLIAELQEKYPFFLKNIDAETASNDELKKRLRDVNELYVKRIALQSQEEKIEKALKVSGEAKAQQLDLERKRRTELNKVVNQFKLPVDLNGIDDFDKQVSAITSELEKLFTVTFSKRDNEPIVKGSLQAFNALEKLKNQYVAASGATSRYTSSLKELEDQQAALKDFEKSLGTDLATIEKLFDVDPDGKTTGGTTGGNSGKKAKDQKKIQDEALKRQDDYLKSIFALQEATEREQRVKRIAAAKVEIQNKTQLKEELENIEIDSARRLEIIEINKQRALLAAREEFFLKKAERENKPVPKDPEFIELGNQLDELDRKFEALFPDRKVDILDILSPKDLGIVKTQVEILNGELSKLKISFNNVTDPKIKEQIKDQIESIKKSIESFQSPKLNNLTFISGGFDAVPLEDILPNDRVQVLRDRLVNIGNSVGNFKERLQEGLVSDPLELKGFDKLMDEGDQIIALFKRLGIELPKETAKIQDATGNVLGVTPEQLRLAGDAIDIVSSGFSEATDIIRAELDKRIGIQEDRVKKAEEVAEKGNVRQLEIEEARLAELQSKREAAVKKQEILEKAAAQAQILLNTAMTISNIQLGVSKTFGASGPAAPITVPIVLAIVGGLIASAANLFKPPTFIEGTEEVGSDPRFIKFKKHHRQDGYTASFDGKERIVDPLTNKELKGFPNKLLPNAVNAYLNPKIRKELLPVAGYHKSDNTDLLKGIEGLRSDVQNLKISTKLDKKGFVQEIQRQVSEVMRREKYKA